MVIPLVSFVILAFWGSRIGKPNASIIALVAIGASCLLAGGVLWGWLGADELGRAEAMRTAYRFHWAKLGDLDLSVGVKLDSLTVIMYFMVTFVAFWIHFFSI
ncbi:MAG TPA: hypothetical protein VMV81_03490, partial [Phycisphaerae bacterium]|nr:hypothetical protein [Phycisphaerae bacterium]